MGIKKKHSQGVEQFADSHNTQANATPQDDIITLEGQMSLFDAPPLKVHNKVRLIELFSGIGAQAKAMQRLGVDWESWGAYDIDPYAVKAYNTIYGTDYVPTDICQMHGSDLNIVDRDKYTYIMTYSFPCQDLSVAGRGKGMAKGSGTRSGLLWEVERLLRELGDELPQILVMENVKQVIGKKNKRDFDLWREALTEMGYDSQYQVMNAKDYGVAQNRERCFMVSWLGDYSYTFPGPIPLKKRLRDYLEDEVDGKYYLTEEQISTFVARTEEHKRNGNGFRFDPIDVGKDDSSAHTIREQYASSSTRRGRIGEQIAQTICCTDEQGVAVEAPFAYDEQNGYARSDGTVGTLTTNGSSPKHNNRVVVPNDEKTEKKDNLRIRKLTPLECWRLMDFDDEDFRKAEAIESNTQLYAQAGNSIVVNCLVAIFGQMFEGKEHIYEK